MLAAQQWIRRRVSTEAKGKQDRRSRLELLECKLVMSKKTERKARRGKDLTKRKKNEQRRRSGKKKVKDKESG